MRQFFFAILLFAFIDGFAQNASTFWVKSDTLNKTRRNALIIGETAAVSIALIGLDRLWYAEYPRSGFHFTNDNNQWLQMDKIGHAMSTYYIGLLGMEMLDWAGIGKKNHLIYGATAGFAFATAVEVLDGFSKEWGFSWGDVTANAAGTGLLIGQELLWQEQRIQLKYSFSRSPYASMRPETLGSGFLEESIKDYNGQTYWLSANIWSFAKDSNFPKWLNLAFGYGSRGMLYANNPPTNTITQNPYRQFYLSIEINLVNIPTKSKFLKSLFTIVNFIKIPAPTIEFRSKGGIKFHYLYF